MPRRRFLQISIRTLLIVTALVAIGCAFWTRVLHRVQQQKLATARIQSLGGTAQTRQPKTPWLWLQRAVGEDYFKEVVSVSLNETLVSDADLEQIGQLRGMQSLFLNGLDPDKNSSFWATRATRLPHNPNLLCSQITNDGIRHLGPQPNLLVAAFAHTRITDAALETISSWPQLQSLDLRGTKVTSRGIDHLGKLERMKVLDLSSCNVDDDAVPTLCQFRSLRSLDVTKTGISGEGLRQLRDQLPGCQVVGEYVELSSGIDADPDSMRWKEITRQLWSLSRSAELKLLILSDPALSDKHLSDLDRLEETDVIDLRRTKVTPASVETLQRALPKCKILR
jgi:hypothetical protein